MTYFTTYKDIKIETGSGPTKSTEITIKTRQPTSQGNIIQIDTISIKVLEAPRTQLE